MSADHPRRSRAISCPPPAGALGRRISPSKSLICGYVFSAQQPQHCDMADEYCNRHILRPRRDAELSFSPLSRTAACTAAPPTRLRASATCTRSQVQRSDKAGQSEGKWAVWVRKVRSNAAI